MQHRQVGIERLCEFERCLPSPFGCGAEISREENVPRERHAGPVAICEPPRSNARVRRTPPQGQSRPHRDPENQVGCAARDEQQRPRFADRGQGAWPRGVRRWLPPTSLEPRSGERDRRKARRSTLLEDPTRNSNSSRLTGTEHGEVDFGERRLLACGLLGIERQGGRTGEVPAIFAVSPFPN